MKVRILHRQSERFDVFSFFFSFFFDRNENVIALATEFRICTPDANNLSHQISSNQILIFPYALVSFLRI